MRIFKSIGKLVLAALLMLAMSTGVKAQNTFPYRTTHHTNAIITVATGNITATNLALFSSFTTASNHRYVEIDMQNLTTNRVFVKQLTFNGTSSGIFSNLTTLALSGLLTNYNSTNAVFLSGCLSIDPCITSNSAAGGITTGAAGKVVIREVIPANGPGIGQITYVFQGGTNDMGSNTVGTVLISADGY